MLICVASHACMCCRWVFVCVPIRNTGSALILSGPEDMELWQPRLCWVTHLATPNTSNSVMLVPGLTSMDISAETESLPLLRII